MRLSGHDQTKKKIKNDKPTRIEQAISRRKWRNAQDDGLWFGIDYSSIYSVIRLLTIGSKLTKNLFLSNILYLYVQ